MSFLRSIFCQAIRSIALFLFLGFVVSATFAQSRVERHWVDSVMRTLSDEQMAAQLMVVRVPLNLSDSDAEVFAQQLVDRQIGGVCFFAGTSPRQLELTRRFQRDMQVPLMVCLDAEWGLGMRLRDCFSFPRQGVFEKLHPDSDTLAYFIGREIGIQCRKMGVHVNFAPVVDVNSNPLNPVIGTRSFSADPNRVAHLGSLYMRGLQSQGVMAVAKHFPGHGDTKTDSHLELPVLNHTHAYMDTIDLLPFRRLIADGVQGVMTAHLQVNSYDSLHPSSLSEVLVSDLLRKKMGFKGIVFTDGLDMKGVTNHYSNGQGELQALRAGNDILLLPPDVPQAIQLIAATMKQDSKFRKLVEMRCRRVLRAKYHFLHPIDGLGAIQPSAIPDEADSLRCRAIVNGIKLYQDSILDALVMNGIEKHAYPGCQILVAQYGNIIFSRSYGSQSYDTTFCPVTDSTIYDLASLTKITATTIALMKLVDEGKVNLDEKLSHYLHYLRKTNKKDITVRQALSHCARLKAYDNYWQKTDDPDKILKLIAQSPLQSKDGYLYSDLGFILLGDLVREVSGHSLDKFMQRNFYQPLHMNHTAFKPLEHGFDLQNIAPTELDSIFRKELIHGTVHDPNAYALGEVSGHAGLFSNASDLFLLMQMLLNGGELDGHRYLSKEVINTFNSRSYAAKGNRRALGFDKPLIHDRSSHVAPEASQSSFGHTGFTGTMIWVDPQYQLIYIFLSNRVHPSATPNRLAQMNIRTDIQSRIYQLLVEKQEK